MGGDGSDRIRQRGNSGRDRLVADGGNGNDVIHQKGGKGKDSIIYRASAGRDRVTINGGKGKDEALIMTEGFPVVVKKGNKILFASGDEKTATVIRVKRVENIEIIDENGNVVFSRGKGFNGKRPSNKDFSEKETTLDSEIKKLKKSRRRRRRRDRKRRGRKGLRSRWTGGKGNDRMKQRGGRGRDTIPR